MIKRRIILYGTIFVGGLIIALSVLYYLSLVRYLQALEKEKVRLWTMAIQLGTQPEGATTLALEIVKSKHQIPAIVIDNDGNIVTFRNVDSLILKDSAYLSSMLQDFKEYSKPLTLDIDDKKKWYVFFGPTPILKQLKIFPYVQISLIVVFVVLILLLVKYYNTAVEKSLWIDLARETAHQIGTPLTALFAWLDLLERKPPDPSVIIDQMRIDLQRLDTIARRFNRLGGAIFKKRTNLNKVLQQTIEYLQPRLNPEVDMIISLPDEDVLVFVDPVLISWAFENLIKNAVRAVGDTGIVKISLRKEGKNAVVDIEDNGPGIPPLVRKTLFAPGISTTGGWGIGLAVVRRIVKDIHGGEVKLVRTGKSGTLFRIYLPLLEE